MQMLAFVGATYDRGRPGMAWRNIWDTTNDPTIAQRASLPYRNYQMSEDYYSGGQLIWLAVDAKIRELTHNRRNLNNFARDFFGVDPGAWDINTYGFDDIVAALNKVAPYDWKTFLDTPPEGPRQPVQGVRRRGLEAGLHRQAQRCGQGVRASLPLRRPDLFHRYPRQPEGPDARRAVEQPGVQGRPGAVHDHRRRERQGLRPRRAQACGERGRQGQGADQAAGQGLQRVPHPQHRLPRWPASTRTWCASRAGRTTCRRC